MQQTVQKTSLPTELNSPAAKLVYLYLTTHNGASLSELESGLSMKKISLYSILKTLSKRGLVHQQAEQYQAAQ
ncbi:TrmB family transcriptional regulator [Haloferax sp. DFSO60]|uniref:TrmB family transcriptional regulator n=1 Tax=Haloferax sp. DFSO60 TaxID=3388652 RepID=UPI003979B607